MNYKNRLLEAKLTAVAEHFPVIVLTGARQVGKTTLLQHMLPETTVVTFDPVIDIGNARQDPELFLDHVGTPVLLDEIQYAPEVMAVIKRRVDKNKSPGQYWLTGSQNLSVLKDVAESLAGRAAVFSLLPMSLGESLNEPANWIEKLMAEPMEFLQKPQKRVSREDTMSVFTLLWRGGYPGILELDDNILPDALESYFKTYIERDVRLLSDVNDLQEFSRFVQLISNLTAQEINHSQLGREIGINPQTAKRWLNILTSTYQWLEIQPFHGNMLKRISGRNKGYFIDTGMANYLMHISSPQALPGHPKLGALFETFVVLDILKQLASCSVKPAIYHWRAHSGAELDLLLELDNNYIPIEIKCKSRPTKGDVRGIEAFRTTYSHLNIEPGIVIAPVDKIFPLDKNNFAVPFDLLC